MAEIKQIKIGNTTYNIEPYTSYVTLSTQQDNISGRKTFTDSVKISGRYQDSGDDEGLIIGKATNNYAGVCLGDPSGVRSVFYLKPDNTTIWRWNPAGSDSYDIYHPGKAGTIALTSDITTAIGNIIDSEETYKTFKIVAEYIAADKTGAADMMDRITANANAIANEKTRAEGAESDLSTRVTTNTTSIEEIKTTYMPLAGGKNMTGAFTMNTGTGIGFAYTSKKAGTATKAGTGGDPWIYAKDAPDYGIRYYEGDVDQMAFSATGNNNNTLNADLCINGVGDGTVTIRGSQIITAGNADTVLPYRLRAYTSSTVAANNATSQGWYYISDGDTNRPPFLNVIDAGSKDYRIMTNAYSNRWLQQIATNFRSNDLFIRRCQDGTWKGWTSIVKMEEGLAAPTGTANAIPRWHGTVNSTLKNSGVTINDSNHVTAAKFIGTWSGGNVTDGHVYLTGSNASSSTGNTTQLVFGTSTTNHVALSANNNALIINPTTGSTTNQIVLYLDQQSAFPSGITSSGVINAATLQENSVALSDKYVSITKNASVGVVGNTKDTYTYNKTTIFAPNGLIMGGTAASAGLVTRGICGASTPNATTGACTKDHLYLNYDGNNTWNAATRAVIINAGDKGTDLGSGMYQYAAVRGDIVKAWVEAKGYVTTDTKVTQAYSTTNANYPLLFSATSGVSSTSSRGATTTILCNKIYANPSTGSLETGSLVTGSITCDSLSSDGGISASGNIEADGGRLHTTRYVSVYDDDDEYKGTDNFDGDDVDTKYYAKGITVDTGYHLSFPAKSGTIALTSDIPSTSSFVTLAGSQTITGAKTFSTPVVITHNTSATYYQRLIYDNHRNSGMKYDYGGNEALIISAGTYAQSSMHFYTSGRLTMNDSSSNQWSGTTPCMAIKNKCVAINSYFSGTPSHNLYVTGTAYFSDSITASSVYATSDERLKENITTAELNYYDFVNNIHLVNYTWKDDENHSLQHGVIAQELQNIIPDELKDHFILTDKGCDDMLAVNDGKLVYIALGALQQQAKINAQLEERISKLEKLLGV